MKLQIAFYACLFLQTEAYRFPGSLSQGGLNSQADCEQCQIPQPHRPDQPVLYPGDYCQEITYNEDFDYIVVGAGPAGATVARRLAENPKHRVLLIEAGDNPPSASDIPTGRGVQPYQLWNIKTQPSKQQCAGYPNNSCSYLYAKFLGGTSVVNLMMYARGNHKDYDMWSQNGGEGDWSWKIMKKYFLKLENYQDPYHKAHPDYGYHSQGGPFTTSPSQMDPLLNKFLQSFEDSLGRLNIVKNNDFNGRSQIGYGQVTGLLETNGYRGNVAKAYLLRVPDNLKVCKNSIVSRVIIKNKIAVGVEFTHNNTGKFEKKMAHATKEHILSGGPISSPQILERSGIGQREVLEAAGVKLIHELRGVGENLYEQFTNLGCAFTLDPQTMAARNPLSISLTAYSIFLNMDDFSDPIPQLQWIFVPFSPEYMHYKPEIIAQYESVNSTRFIFMAGSTILRQANPGYVHIKGTDPTKSPLYNPNQFSAKSESIVTTKGCRLIRKALLEDPVMEKFDVKPFILKECEQYEYNSEEEIMCAARLVAFPTHHMAGTTQMGPSTDPKRVVDSRLRVHGIKKLRVSDLGVMPAVPRSNTEVPSMAVSERAADILKEDAGEKISAGGGKGIFSALSFLASKLTSDLFSLAL